MIFQLVILVFAGCTWNKNPWISRQVHRFSVGILLPFQPRNLGGFQNSKTASAHRDGKNDVSHRSFSGEICYIAKQHTMISSGRTNMLIYEFPREENSLIFSVVQWSTAIVQVPPRSEKTMELIYRWGWMHQWSEMPHDASSWNHKLHFLFWRGRQEVPMIKQNNKTYPDFILDAGCGARQTTWKQSHKLLALGNHRHCR